VQLSYILGRKFLSRDIEATAPITVRSQLLMSVSISKRADADKARRSAILRLLPSLKRTTYMHQRRPGSPSAAWCTVCD